MGLIGGERHFRRIKVLWVGESKIKEAVTVLAWLKRWNREMGQLRWGRGGSWEAPGCGGGENRLSGVRGDGMQSAHVEASGLESGDSEDVLSGEPA